MTPKEIYQHFLQLEPKQQLIALYAGGQLALGVWQDYIKEEGEIVYIDSVAAMQHIVDSDLPVRALELIRQKTLLLPMQADAEQDIWDEYTEPIVALQDDDLEFPTAVEYAYYTIYNLFSYCFIPKRQVTLELLVNQIISCQLGDDGDNDELIDEKMQLWWAKYNEIV